MTVRRRTPLSRREIPGGYAEWHMATLPGGREVEGCTTFEYVMGEALEPVGAHATLRSTWCNGEPVLDPEVAQAIWREAGWM